MTTYYGVLFGVISIYISNLRVSGILIGAILGLLVSFALIIYKETENINNFIVLFITFYEITEIIVYADHRTIYFKLVVAFYVTLISYIIINHQEKKRKILENNKFFWLGIFFIVGAIFANTIHPLDVPDEW